MTPLCWNHKRHGCFTPLAATCGDYCDVGNLSMLAHDLLDVDRIDILSTRKNHVFLAIHDVKEAVLVELAQVPGSQPARSMRIRPGRLATGLLAIVVTLHEQRPAPDDLSGDA